MEFGMRFRTQASYNSAEVLQTLPSSSVSLQTHQRTLPRLSQSLPREASGSPVRAWGQMANVKGLENTTPLILLWSRKQGSQWRQENKGGVKRQRWGKPAVQTQRPLLCKKPQPCASCQGKIMCSVWGTLGAKRLDVRGFVTAMYTWSVHEDSVFKVGSDSDKNQTQGQLTKVATFSTCCLATTSRVSNTPALNRHSQPENSTPFQ